MRRLLSLLLSCVLLLTAWPRVAMGAGFGPDRVILVPMLTEHPEPSHQWYLDLEGGRLIADAAQADIYFAYGGGDVKVITAAARGVQLATTPYDSALQPVALRREEPLSPSSVFLVQTRNGRMVRAEVQEMYPRMPGYAQIDMVRLRYSMEGDTVQGHFGDTGQNLVTFTGAREVVLRDLGQGGAYLDLDGVRTTQTQALGEVYYKDNQLFHVDGAGLGIQLLEADPGFNRSSAVYRSGFQHAVPFIAGTTYIFRTAKGQHYKVKAVVESSYNATLLVAPEGPAPVVGYEHAPPGTMGAMTVVAAKGPLASMSIDLLGQRLVGEAAAHLTLTPSGLTVGPRSRGVARTRSMEDFGSDYAKAFLPAKAGDTFAILTEQNVVFRLKVLELSSAAIRALVAPVVTTYDEQNRAQQHVALPLEVPDPALARQDADPFDIAHVLLPSEALADLAGGRVFFLLGIGPGSKLGLVGGTLYTTAGFKTDPTALLESGGLTSPEVTYDGAYLRAGSGGRGLSPLGAQSVEQVRAPHDGGEVGPAAPISSKRETWLSVAKSGGTALVRIDEVAQIPQAWVRLQVYYQPDGSLNFFLPALEPPPPPPPPPPPTQTVVQLQINNTIATVNGVPTTLDTAPAIIGGRTLVPLRFIAEAFGADVKYDGPTKRITIVLVDTVVVMYLNNQVATVNGKEYVLDTPPVSVNGRTLVPVRFVAEGLDAEVKWDNSTKTVTITR